MKKKRISALLPWIFILAAALVLMSPEFFRAVTSIRQAKLLMLYLSEAESLTDAALVSMRAEAAAYNRAVAVKQMTTPFVYQGEDVSDPEYELMLCTIPNGTMGSLEIPKINVKLPIAHGTRTDVLEYECGHIYGSSLPTGGEDSHSVLAGHTGLATAELFSSLTKLVPGDCFRICSVGEVHEYSVVETQVVLPGEEWELLQVQKGRDLITLYTCTPYGINDHRLLVTAERVFPDPKVEEDDDRRFAGADEVIEAACCRIAGMLLLTAVLLLRILIVCVRFRKELRTERTGEL